MNFRSYVFLRINRIGCALLFWIPLTNEIRLLTPKTYSVGCFRFCSKMFGVFEMTLLPFFHMSHWYNTNKLRVASWPQKCCWIDQWEITRPQERLFSFHFYLTVFFLIATLRSINASFHYFAFASSWSAVQLTAKHFGPLCPVPNSSSQRSPFDSSPRIKSSLIYL